MALLAGLAVFAAAYVRLHEEKAYDEEDGYGGSDAASESDCCGTRERAGRG